MHQKNLKSRPELKNASLTYPHETASPLVINNGPSHKLKFRHRWKRQIFWKLKLCWNETTYKTKLRTFPLNTEMVPHSLTITVGPIKTFFFSTHCRPDFKLKVFPKSFKIHFRALQQPAWEKRHKKLALSDRLGLFNVFDCRDFTFWKKTTWVIKKNSWKENVYSKWNRI